MKVLADELTEILKHIKQSRDTWQETTRKIILNELNVITSSVLLDWFIDVNDSILNHETISLRFHTRPSGLIFNEDNALNQQEGKSGTILKYGGTLNFSHVYLGDVMVWMTYPYIHEVLENAENFVDLMRLKQENVDSRVIQEAVSKFLHEIIGWHLGKVGQEQRIGFKTSLGDE